MTEDKETIRHLLPSLDTNLVYVQGSKLTPALEMAFTMLENESGNNKAIAVISDGGFEDASAIHSAKKLAEKGILIYTIGIGTLQGVPLKDRQGNVVKNNGSPILSKLEKEKFQEISKIGKGRYFDGDHSEQIALIFEDLTKRSNVQQATHKSQRIWEEHFYLFLLPILPFFLWWYRRGYILALLLILTPTNTQASLSDYFYNSEQLANHMYEGGDYERAGHAFQDPYRKGVAYYRQGDFKAAEEMFRQSTRPEVAANAAYNLGNTLAKQNKLQEAITAYGDVLKKWPDHKLAKENLDLVKEMLEQQEQQKSDNQNQQKNADKQKDSQDQQQDEQKKDSQKSEEQSKEQSQIDYQPEGGESRNLEQSKSKNISEEDEPELNKEEIQQSPEQDVPIQQEKRKPTSRSQEDLDADLWLNQIKNDPSSFLKNKFYLESRKNGTKEEVNPW
jgi:Ca-activated chloride channel family protein